MSWPTGGTLGDGWEDVDTEIDTLALEVPLPIAVVGRWYDPAPLAGLGTLVPSVGLTFGDSLVEVRQRSRRLEIALTRRDLFGVALLDSFQAEILEGVPCSVLLTVYDDDKETIAWEVSTDPDHPNPYLAEPDDYGEQELDVAKGSAAIGTVGVVVVDRRRIAGDQASGYVTDKLASLGLAAVAGRRGRVVRFIEPALGYQVIADGPIGTPRMDPSYAAFQFSVRDTRETERKSRLTRGGDRSLLPLGVRDGYGYNADTATWLLDPAPVLTGTWDNSSHPDWSPWGATPYMIDIPTETFPVAVFEELENAAHDPVTDVLGALNYYTLIPIDAIFEWRAASSSDPWTRVGLTGDPDGPSAVLASLGTVGTGILFSQVHFTGAGAGPWPTLGQSVEFRLLGGRGNISDNLPFYIDDLTAGEFLRNAYDGLYSDLGELGETVPTGIRYDEAALLQMTDPVRIRLREPVDDLRKWLEENIYAPTGWVPALDYDGRISPISQNVPSEILTLEAITDAIAEPAPEWNAGETIYNVVRFVYVRDYKPTDPEEAETLDGLAEREVVVEYEDSVSVLRHGRKVLELKGDAFRAVGDAEALPVVTLETGGALATDRGTEMLNRYSLGAPTMQLNVMRRALPLLRAGDWVVVSLSWMPDYVTGKRGLVALCQIVALGDLDCAWRKVTIEVVTTLLVS